MYMRAIARFLLIASFGAAFVAPACNAQVINFIALGDLPYGPREKSYPAYRALIRTVNAARPDFAIHIGDFKSGSTECSDEEFRNQLSHFQEFSGALVYTPGDNEWTDCHRRNNGAYDPLERLQTLRGMFFSEGRSLGAQPIPVESQSRTAPGRAGFVENQRFMRDSVLFATVHIVGSNNNFEIRDPKAVTEFMERDAANVEWIRDAYALAETRGASALVFAFQADVLDTRSPFEDFPPWSGFRSSIGETLLPLAARWGRPVLMISGDSHRFKVDQPFRLNGKPLRNVTRLVVPGDDDVRAVRVQVIPGAKQPFVFQVIGAGGD